MSVLRRTLGASRTPTVHVRGPVFRLGLLLFLVAWSLRTVARAVVWLLVHPRTSGWLTAGVLIWWAFRHWGGWPLARVAFGLGVLLLLWAHLHPPSWNRWVEWPARGRWRRVWVYRREWQPAMLTTGLALSSTMGNLLPILGRVRARPGLDVVRVKVNPGQTLEDWSRVSGRLAQTFGVLDVRPRTVPGDAHALDLWCVTADPLAGVTPAPVPTVPVDLAAVPVAVTEDGGVFTLPVLFSHTLIAGETGSGKGSVLWSLLAGLAPDVGGGRVKVWAIDPKGGMELQAGAALFDRFEYRDPEAMCLLLEQAVTAMRARIERLRQGQVRKVTPTVATPLIVVVVDELASLVAYVTDPKLKARTVAALSLLLSQGRAPGVVVIAATQDARKETLGMRDLFPTRVALRTAEAQQADMILGEGSRARGARTDLIPTTLPGVGYVLMDGQPEPARVRFGYLDDQQIRDLVAKHTTPLVVA